MNQRYLIIKFVVNTLAPFVSKNLIILVFLVLVSCKSDYYLYSSFHEPATDGLRYLYSRDGMHWDSIPGVWLKPEVGKQKVMRDPSIQSTPDGTYHFVWTSSWRGDRGFGYSSSKDLKNWTKERFVEVMTDTSTVNVWAPELFWDDSRQEMMIVWASCVPYLYSKGEEDEMNNHRLYYTTTKDFKTFTPSRILYDPGFSCIDATLIKTGNQSYVMVLKDNTRPNRNLKVAFASDPHGPWSAASEPFSGNFMEGPSVAKVGSDYIIYFDRYKKFDFGAVRTRDFKHFEDISSQVKIPKNHKHGTIFKAPCRIARELLKCQ